jgi:cell division septation protein DedD
MINLSAYASASGAAALQQKVRALGYPVSSHAITQAGQRRTKVVAGPFATRTAAEAARLKITHSISGVPATLEHSDAQASSASPTTSAHTASAASKAGGWAVQLAAVSGQADANALRDKLRAAGFDGFVDSVNVGGKQLWRVRAGPQTQRADAQRVHDQIKAKLGIDGNIVSVP